MLQNFNSNYTINSSGIGGGSVNQGNSSVEATLTVSSPEFKVGGIYNVNEKIGISLAYLHVWGNTFSYTYSQTISTSPLQIVTNEATSKPPTTLNAVMLGINYLFA